MLTAELQPYVLDRQAKKHSLVNVRSFLRKRGLSIHSIECRLLLAALSMWRAGGGKLSAENLLWDFGIEVSEPELVQLVAWMAQWGFVVREQDAPSGADVDGVEHYGITARGLRFAMELDRLDLISRTNE